MPSRPVPGPRLGPTSPWRALPGLLLVVAVLVNLVGEGGVLAEGWRGMPAAQATPLPRTAGALAPEVGDATGNDLRSRVGSHLAAPASAWRGLTRDERAVLLDGTVAWLPYAALAADDPALAAFDPLAIAALDRAPETALDELVINAVLLDLPPPVLAGALLAGEPETVALDGDTIFVVDHVVVAALPGQAPAGLLRAAVDARGLLITDAPTRPRPTARAAPDQPAAAEIVRRAANGRPIPLIALGELPLEALDTLRLIERGGPFPFAQDGATFGNFEGNLPAAPRGFYREYTVITPGEDDRGARRIVTGAAGDDRIIYYTADHYDSFAEVMLDE